LLGRLELGGVLPSAGTALQCSNIGSKCVERCPQFDDARLCSSQLRFEILYAVVSARSPVGR
jgi:hypothetical protein